MTIRLKEKIISSFFYLLPLSLGELFGYHLTLQYPILNYIRYITFPINLLETILPLSNIVIFIIIYIGVIKNYNLCTVYYILHSMY